MLRKKMIAVMLLMIVLVTNVTVFAAEAMASGTGMAETARSYVLMEASSGKILLEKNMD